MRTAAGPKRRRWKSITRGKNSNSSQTSTTELLIQAAQRLCDAAGQLHFDLPVAYIYNPLDYAWPAHEIYLRRYGGGHKQVLFLGMNPGPFGMVQTGVPFGQIAAVRDWLGIEAKIGAPPRQNPKRPITGFACPRSEISGERLWGLFAKRFGSAANFFQEHFVANYCPLAFMEMSGRNLTPDKLNTATRAPLFAICDQHLRDTVRIMRPEWLIGVGEFATKRARELFQGEPLRVAGIAHPSPASPAANRDWAGLATSQLRQLGIWK